MTNRILITGGTGFLGCHLSEYLINKGYTIVLLSRKESNIANSEELSQIKCDVTDYGAVSEIIKDIDGIIHLAAVGRESQGTADPYNCIRVNTLGTLNILESVRRLSIKPWIILASSAAVKDVAARDNNCILKTSDSMYGISKLFNELCAYRYSIEHSMQIIVLRLESIYGSLKDNPEKVVNKFIMKALANKTIDVCDTSAKLNFIHYQDVINAIYIIINKITSLERPYYDEIYLGARSNVDIEELANRIIKLCKSKSKIVIHENCENRKHQSRHKSRLGKELAMIDFNPSIALDDGLSDLVMQYESANV